MLIVTEESKSFSCERGAAFEVFSGSFASIHGTLKSLQERGREADLYIITSAYGLIPAHTQIDRYVPDVRGLKKHADSVGSKLGVLLQQYRDVALLLSSPYAEFVARVLAGERIIRRSRRGPRVYIVSGSAGARALEEVLTNRAEEVIAFARPGVARITNSARMALLNAQS